MSALNHEAAGVLTPAVQAYRLAGRDGEPITKKLVSQTLAIANFTDNTNTTGYIDFTTGAIPAGSLVLGFRAYVTTGFVGDTTAIISVGISGNTAAWTAYVSNSVLTPNTVKASAAVAATAYISGTPRVTVTGSADFTSITTGSMVVEVYYI